MSEVLVPSPFILIVEDSPADARLFIEMLRESKLNYRYHLVRDGVQAMRYLQGHESSHFHVNPDLIVLDLNLPKKDGREVLKEIKQDPSLSMIPVLVLSTSASESDINRCYQLHANCYVSKPRDLPSYRSVIRKLEDFWLTAAVLPHCL